MVVEWVAVPIPAFLCEPTHDPSPLPLRGAEVGAALLVNFYDELPELGEDANRAAQVAPVVREDPEGWEDLPRQPRSDCLRGWA